MTIQTSTTRCAAPKAATKRASKTVPIADRCLVDEVTAAQMVGVSRTNFRRFVAAGLIAPVALPFSIKRNLYTRGAIDQLVSGFGGDA